MVKRVALLFLLLFCVSVPALAEISSSVKLTLMNTLATTDDETVSFTGFGTGRLTFKSAGSKKVKGQLSLDARIGDTALLDVTRAFVKARFPGFRITLGKDTVAWGEGVFYNAGDVIFGAVPKEEDLSAEVFRDDAVWLTSAYVPLGDYSFVEPILLAPELNLSTLARDPSASPPSLSDAAAGVRVVTKLAGIKTEAGYLYRGEERTHNPYFSLQGHLLVDLHLSGSVSVPHYPGEAPGAGAKPVVSFGLFHLQRFSGAGSDSISFRLEGLLRPLGDWKAQDSSRTDADSDPDTEYALMLYPEVAWALDQSLTLLCRSVVSPIDLSALVIAGVNWNVYEGLKLLGYLSVQAGEKTDLYGLRKGGGLGLTVGVQYIF
ncbi:MAG TPA: hypothetical protein VMZ05_12140 [Spirochaetota bacterium]|nr:hypothetical protein [Spirochaetota bacterium]